MHKNIPVSDTQKRGKRKTGETIKAFARFLMSVKKYRGWLILSVVLAVERLRKQTPLLMSLNTTGR